MQAAKARKVDYVIVDTAGRLQTKENLMLELQQDEPHRAKSYPRTRPTKCCWCWTPLPGRTAWSRRVSSPKARGVTGIVLTKLDGTAKGGIVVAIARELNLPIRYIGVGEKVEDLLPFDAEKFIESLFS